MSVKELDDATDYLYDLETATVISKEEQFKYFIQFQRGDISARNKLIESCLRWVVKIAGKYRGKGIPYLDLIQEANMHLMRAVEDWRPELGQLSTIVYCYVTNGLKNLLTPNHHGIYLPLSTTKQLNLLKGGESVDEIKDKLKISRHRAATLAELKLALLPAQEHNEPSYEVFEDEEKAVNRKKLRYEIDKLPEQLATIIRLKYGIGSNRLPPFSNKEIAEKLQLKLAEVVSLVAEAERLLCRVKICKCCRARFLQKVSTKVYCSAKCAQRTNTYPFQRRCRHCKKKFRIEGPEMRANFYCSKECRKIRKRICKKKCEICEKHVRYTTSRYCSRACAGIALSRKAKVKRAKKKCSHCQKEITRKCRSQKYCSPDCAFQGARRKPRKCKFCKKQFQPNKTAQKFCNHECHARSRAKPKRNKTCLNCDNVFLPRREGVRFCSRGCVKGRLQKPTRSEKEHAECLN